MICRFVLKKINDNNDFAGVGTAGNIFMVMNALLNLRLGQKLFVDFETNGSVNTENHEIHGTRNSWYYYFDNTFDITDEPISTMTNLRNYLNYELCYLNINSRKIKRLSSMFWQNFKLQDDLEYAIVKFINEHIANNITLGVQIRLTDMIESHSVPNIEKYIVKINKVLKNNPNITQIFIATDDQSVIKRLINIYPNYKIIYQDNIFRATLNSKHETPYERYYDCRINHKYLLGKEVIIDIFLLSNCDFLLKAHTSAISHLAAFFSDENCRIIHMKSINECIVSKVKSFVNYLKMVIYSD